jgi:hypothetical protein
MQMTFNLFFMETNSQNLTDHAFISTKNGVNMKNYDRTLLNQIIKFKNKFLCFVLKKIV